MSTFHAAQPPRNQSHTDQRNQSQTNGYTETLGSPDNAT